jgi:plasmid stabilization system protein ParE
MGCFWTDEALGELQSSRLSYDRAAGPTTAQAEEKRIVAEIEALPAFPEPIRTSGRVPGTRERIVRRLPYLVFVKVVTAGVAFSGVSGTVAPPSAPA